MEDKKKKKKAKAKAKKGLTKEIVSQTEVEHELLNEDGE